MEHPVIGKMKTLGFASKLSGTPASIRQPAPLYAQHTDEVLEQLGIDEAQRQALRDRGAIN
jgi:formyl-CoA transferase